MNENELFVPEWVTWQPSSPIGPPYYDEMWDKVDRRGGLGHYRPNGQRISMRDLVYVFEKAGKSQKAHKKIKQVAQDFVGPIRVSTVWLGNDHSYGWGGPPIIFETMCFERRRSWLEPVTFEGVDGIERTMAGRWTNRSVDDFFDRYSTWKQAQQGHWRIRKEVREWLHQSHGPGKWATA